MVILIIDCVIAKIVLRNVDLLVEDNKFETLLYLHRKTFTDFDICQQMIPVRKLYPTTLTYFSRQQMGILSRMQRELAQKCEVTLIPDI